LKAKKKDASVGIRLCVWKTRHVSSETCFGNNYQRMKRLKVFKRWQWKPKYNNINPKGRNSCDNESLKKKKKKTLAPKTSGCE